MRDGAFIDMNQGGSLEVRNGASLLAEHAAKMSLVDSSDIGMSGTSKIATSGDAQIVASGDASIEMEQSAQISMNQGARISMTGSSRLNMGTTAVIASVPNGGFRGLNGNLEFKHNITELATGTSNSITGLTRLYSMDMNTSYDITGTETAGGQAPISIGDVFYFIALFSGEDHEATIRYMTQGGSFGDVTVKSNESAALMFMGMIGGHQPSFVKIN
jgi:hypothetical protein